MNAAIEEAFLVVPTRAPRQDTGDVQVFAESLAPHGLRQNSLSRSFVVAAAGRVHVVVDAGHPYTAFSVQVDGAAGRGRRVLSEVGQDHRYYYARFDGDRWRVSELAFAGRRLYPARTTTRGSWRSIQRMPTPWSSPPMPHPASGVPLISEVDDQRHHELFRGTTRDGGATWEWTPITRNSTVDNLRPIIPANHGGDRVLLWFRGELRSFTDYHLDVCGLVESR